MTAPANDHWTNRASNPLVAAYDRYGVPLTTPMDRRWLWRIEGALAISSQHDSQLLKDLKQYLYETCEHHWLHYDGDEVVAEHRQCMWCDTVDWKGEGF